MTKIIQGRTYTKRSAITGKSRALTVVRSAGERIECIAEDNGRTIIVRRTRLHRDSRVMTDQTTFAPNDDLAARLDELLAKLGANNDDISLIQSIAIFGAVEMMREQIASKTTLGQFGNGPTDSIGETFRIEYGKFSAEAIAKLCEEKI